MTTNNPSDGVHNAKGFGPAYRFMAFVGERSVKHFFRRLEIVGGQDVPKEGTFILCCTHFSTLMDVAIISAYLPHGRPIHYWAKRGLYKRQPFRWILENSGNIQVDRKEKNNQKLFAGTFEAMQAGEPIGLFPEGGSYTEHRLHSMKAGAAWAALEYAKHLASQGITDPDKARVLIVPAAINYTDKSRFRSEAIFEFGKAFSVQEYVEEFLKPATANESMSALLDNAPPTPGPSLITNGIDGPHPPSRLRLGLDIGNVSATSGDETATSAAMLRNTSTSGNELASSKALQRISKAPSNSPSARAAVQKLTDRIGAEIYKMTVDAPDWTTWHSIKMSREIIWKRHLQLPLTNLVPISNNLGKVLNANLPQARLANETLCALQGLVLAASTDVYTLNAVARLFHLPRRAMQMPNDGNEDEFTLPSRKRAEKAVPNVIPATIFLARQIITLAIRLPYVLPLAMIYAPAYTIGWWLSKKYSSHEEESMASSKSLCAFVIAGLTHVALITFFAAIFLFTPIGWALGIGISVAIEKSHVWLLDETYTYLKKLVVAWRIFLAAVSLQIGGQKYGQLGSENSIVRLAVDVVKSQPGIQWSLIKALRLQNAAAKSHHEKRLNTPTASGSATPQGETAAPPPNVRPKVFNRSGRPPCYQLMGVTRLIHAQAVQALHELFEELEHKERQHQQAKGQSSSQDSLDDATLEAYRYLRRQMQVTNASILPPQKRFVLGRRSR